MVNVDWLAVRVEDEGGDHDDSKGYDLSSWVNWNECSETMEEGEGLGLEEKMKSVWNILGLDAFEAFQWSCWEGSWIYRYSGGR